MSGAIEPGMALGTGEAVGLPVSRLGLGAGLDVDGLLLDGFAALSGHIGNGYIGRDRLRQDKTIVRMCADYLFQSEAGDPKGYVGWTDACDKGTWEISGYR